LLDELGYLGIDLNDACEGYVRFGIGELAAPRHVSDPAVPIHAHYFVEPCPPFDSDHLTNIRNFSSYTAGLDDRRNVRGPHDTPQTRFYTRAATRRTSFIA
jgi:hypothetical protein